MDLFELNAKEDRLYKLEEICGVVMVNADYIRDTLVQTVRPYFDGDWLQHRKLTITDTETWLCTLVDVWNLEKGKDYEYVDVRKKCARRDTRTFYISLDLAFRIATFYKDDVLFQELEQDRLSLEVVAL